MDGECSRYFDRAHAPIPAPAFPALPSVHTSFLDAIEKIYNQDPLSIYRVRAGGARRSFDERLWNIMSQKGF
jgi:hypothetical protein